MNKKKVSVVIPCYNEEENIFPIFEAVQKEIREYDPAYDYEILFIDNKSKDGTRKKLRELCEKDNHAKAIFNVKNFGQNNSPFYGLLNSTGDCTILMACDFQDPVEMIPKFLNEWENGHKIVIGKKMSSTENKLMYFLRGCYYNLIQRLSDVQMIEQFTGFGLYDRSFVSTLKELSDPMPFFRGLVAELGPEYTAIEFVQPPRRAGKTNNNFFSLYDIAMLSFTSYTKAGMRIATFGGGAVAVISFLVGVVYLIANLFAKEPCAVGYLPVLTAAFFIGGVQLAFMGFMGEYILAINSRIMNRPLVVEECRLNFEK